MMDDLRARKLRNQVKEVKVKLIVYNINKKVMEIIYIKLRISTEPFFLLFIIVIVEFPVEVIDLVVGLSICFK